MLAEGYRVVGFDNERHVYGEERYPGQLVLQDVLTIHGKQFKDAALIVASPPCQAYSYRAMPWKRAKALPPPSNALFDACFRIQREAIEAAGHFIPLVVENVRGAQKYVGRAKAHFGSFYIWGDVPALMPLAIGGRKHGGDCFNDPTWPGKQGGVKTVGHLNKRNGHSHTRHLTNQAEHCICPKKCDCQNPDGAGVAHVSEECPIHNYNPRYVEECPVHDPDVARDGIKQAGISGVRTNGKGDRWFQDGAATHGSKSPARKRASALIAKIPLALSRHIAASWYPMDPSPAQYLPVSRAKVGLA